MSIRDINAALGLPQIGYISLLTTLNAIQYLKNRAGGNNVEADRLKTIIIQQHTRTKTGKGHVGILLDIAVTNKINTALNLPGKSDAPLNSTLNAIADLKLLAGEDASTLLPAQKITAQEADLITSSIQK